MNLFQKLISKRSEVARELDQHRAMVIKSERAVSLCDKLEAGLPALIASIQQITTLPFFSDYRTNEDFVGRSDLAREAHAIRAAENLLKDLPAIRAHWTKVRDELRG